MNFPGKEGLLRFFEHCKKAVEDYDIDCFVLTGDISEAPKVQGHLELLRDYLNRPCYFVCGNHDFYDGSILEVRNRLSGAFNDKGNMCYLTATDYVSLNQNIALVGHDGWYDGMYADWFKSKLVMNDYHVIEEFKPLFDKGLFNKIQYLSRESAQHVTDMTNKAIADGHKTIVIATHVPPFPENSTYNGKISDGDWLPHFSSGIMGDHLLQLAGLNKDVQFLVLCGHSHGEAKYVPSVGNMIVYTGKAEYGLPKISRIHIVD